MKQFRKNHLLNILSLSFNLEKPIDYLLNQYFKEHKSIGSKDRKEIAQAFYFIVRHLGIIDYAIQGSPTPEKRLEAYLQKSYALFLEDSQTPLHIKHNFPKDFFSYLCMQIGQEQAYKFCEISNGQAPTTIRINPLLITREKFKDQYGAQFPGVFCKHSPYGIELYKREALFASEAFKKGFFEMQDEGSQLLALEVQAKPNDHVLDYCCGSGGKTLAFAQQMKGKGQIYLHDIRKHALYQARKRLKRAHIQNYQLVFDKNHLRKKCPQKFDWILLDVPCSGSGTLRRNPDQKWKFSFKMIERLIQEQKAIFDEAFSLAKEGGKIVYCTCSIFPDENEAQVKYFLKNYPVKLVKEPLSLFPQENGMDGFFAVTFEKEA